MTEQERILKGIKMLGNGNTKTFLASVENNYPDKDYIDVKDLSGTIYHDVRKRAVIGTGNDAKKGIVITPVSGSSVIVSRIGDSDELFVEMFSEVESIIIDGGDNGGLTITPELKTQLDKLTARVDGIINAINSQTVIPVPQDGGTALLSLLRLEIAKITDKEKFDKIENTKIKH